MPYQTDEKLKSFLDTNQLHREQLCRAVLATDKRFSDVRPRHPRGGPDGGRDMEAVFRVDQLAYGAVGFVNQANDSDKQKREIRSKFSGDLKSAVSAPDRPEVFVFFTNINLTAGEKDLLVAEAKKAELKHCEIFDRERLRIALDGPDGFSIRFQYLNIPLSEAEQASFFARWGDDIQSIVSTGFQRVENALNRILFFQEAGDSLRHLTLSFELDRKYSSDEIGHFRLFCSMYLKEPKNKIWGILFGSSDKSRRMRSNEAADFTEQPPGVKHGISGGQWESYVDLEPENEDDSQGEEGERYKQVSWSSAVGMEDAEFLVISYRSDSFIRIAPSISLRDLDEAMFLPFLNRTLAQKICAIHIYSNGYKVQEIGPGGFRIDATNVEPEIPVQFSPDELEDSWACLRPADGSSTFHVNFFEQTPKRMFVPEQVINSLEERKQR